MNHRGRVTLGGVANRIRSGYGTEYPKIGEIPPGGEFIVRHGPEYGDGYEWWLVDYQGVLGWTAAGANGEPWLEKVGGSSGGGEGYSRPRVKKISGSDYFRDGGDFIARLDYTMSVTYDTSGNSVRVRGVTLEYVVDPFSTARFVCWATASVHLKNSEGSTIFRDNGWNIWAILFDDNPDSIDLVPYLNVGAFGSIDAAVQYSCVVFNSNEEYARAIRSTEPVRGAEPAYFNLSLAIP